MLVQISCYWIPNDIASLVATVMCGLTRSPIVTRLFDLYERVPGDLHALKVLHLFSRVFPYWTLRAFNRKPGYRQVAYEHQT